MRPFPARPWASPRRLAVTSLATATLLAISGVLAGPTSAQPAQRERSARDVAALVQSFYDQTTTFQASFYQTRYTKVYNRYDRARGTVVFKKPGKMRWDYSQPNGQVFVSDGSHLLVYQPPDEGEEHGQMFERAVSEDQLPLAFSFLTGTGRLDRDFRFRLLDPGRQGFENGYVLELRPREASPHYDRVLFFVRVPDDAPAGVIHRVLIIDAQGNRNRFDFSEMRFNRNVQDNRFEYTPPAGTRTVQP